MRARLRELPGRLHRRAGDLAVGLELQQLRVHLPARGLFETSGEVLPAVDERDELGDPERARLQHREDLLLALVAVRDVLLDPRPRVFDDVTVTRVEPAEAQLL